MASAASHDAGDASAGGGCKGHPRRSGSGLQYTERVHRSVPKGPRYHSHALFQDVCTGLNSPSPPSNRVQRIARIKAIALPLAHCATPISFTPQNIDSKSNRSVDGNRPNARIDPFKSISFFG